MDLIIVFIIFSIIMNIIGSVKKQNKRQTVRRHKSTASSRRDFRSLIENDIFSIPKKPVSQKAKVNEKTDSFAGEKAGYINFKDIKRPIETINTDTGSLELKSSPTIGLTDMQRAIVMAEVLGKPKAFRR